MTMDRVQNILKKVSLVKCCDWLALEFRHGEDHWYSLWGQVFSVPSGTHGQRTWAADEPPTDLMGHRQHPGGQGLLSHPCKHQRVYLRQKASCKGTTCGPVHPVWARPLEFPFLKGCFCPKPLTFYGNNLMAGIPCTQGSSQDLASQERTQALAQTRPPGTGERSLSGFTEGKESVKVPFC